jgi:uroporphyrinogen-III synthase
MIERRSVPVVITRPVAQALPLAALLGSFGREAIVFPLLEIHPFTDQTVLRARLDHLADYTLVAFVSPNAINVTLPLVRAWPREVAIAVMGEGSRHALAAHGIDLTGVAGPPVFSPRNSARTDSQTLIEALDLNALRNRRVLIVRGEHGRELLADALRAHSVQVEQVAAYQRQASVLDAHRSTQLKQLLDSHCDWIITSSEALHFLLDMVRAIAGDSGVAKMQQQALIVPHVRIAETAAILGFLDITRTGSGDEQLLAALQSRA